jgi:hypothetical protein
MENTRDSGTNKEPTIDSIKAKSMEHRESLEQEYRGVNLREVAEAVARTDQYKPLGTHLTPADIKHIARCDDCLSNVDKAVSDSIMADAEEPELEEGETEWGEERPIDSFPEETVDAIKAKIQAKYPGTKVLTEKEYEAEQATKGGKPYGKPVVNQTETISVENKEAEQQ